MRCLAILLAGVATTAVPLAMPPTAGPGTAELHLDRASVARLVAAAVPEPFELPLAGFGVVRVEPGPPRDVRFRDGAVEVSLSVRLPRQGIEAPLSLRYRPEIDPLYGVARLVAEKALLDVPPLQIDLAPWVGSLPLPRVASWELELDGGAELAVRAYLQDVRVEEERLVLLLGLRLAGR